MANFSNVDSSGDVNQTDMQLMLIKAKSLNASNQDGSHKSQRILGRKAMVGVSQTSLENEEIGSARIFDEMQRGSQQILKTENDYS